MKMRCFACVSHSIADDQGQLTEAEMNRLCYFGASIVTCSAVAQHCVKAHMQSQWRKLKFDPRKI